MVMQATKAREIIYPESDGKPMADNTVQFRWITVIHYNLEWLFANNPNVFIAGDLLWYPVEHDTGTSQAPDVMVVFGRPKGDRGSYLQWQEGNIAPQVVFEIRSPKNTQTEMDEKWDFYNDYGVEEYYLYDRDQNDLSGWLRSQSDLDVIDQMDGWVSPRLHIRFDMSGESLQLYHPKGKAFATYLEISKQLEQTNKELELMRQQKELDRKLELARQEKHRLKELLRSAGIDPDKIDLTTAEDPDDESIESVKASLRRSLAEAKEGKRLPIDRLWSGIDAD